MSLVMESKHNQVTKETLEVKNNKSGFVNWGWNRRTSNRFLLLRSTTVSSWRERAFCFGDEMYLGEQETKSSDRGESFRCTDHPVFAPVLFWNYTPPSATPEITCRHIQRLSASNSKF
ncbi:hypothetical protein LXL04_002517 [Taraxacum kok-saghyz]